MSVKRRSSILSLRISSTELWTVTMVRSSVRERQRRNDWICRNYHVLRTNRCGKDAHHDRIRRELSESRNHSSDIAASLPGDQHSTRLLLQRAVRDQPSSDVEKNCHVSLSALPIWRSTTIKCVIFFERWIRLPTINNSSHNYPLVKIRVSCISKDSPIEWPTAKKRAWTSYSKEKPIEPSVNIFWINNRRVRIASSRFSSNVDHCSARMTNTPSRNWT